jgi:hypothetical protein
MIQHNTKEQCNIVDANGKDRCSQTATLTDIAPNKALFSSIEDHADDHAQQSEGWTNEGSTEKHGPKRLSRCRRMALTRPPSDHDPLPLINEWAKESTVVFEISTMKFQQVYVWSRYPKKFVTTASLHRILQDLDHHCSIEPLGGTRSRNYFEPKSASTLRIRPWAMLPNWKTTRKSFGKAMI